MTPKEFQERRISPDIPQFICVVDGKSYANRICRGVRVVGGQDCAIFYTFPNIGTLMPLSIPIANIVYISPMDMHLECERKYAEYCGAKESGRKSPEQEMNKQEMQQLIEWVKANNPDYLKFRPESW